MPIRVECAGCQKKFQVADSAVGKSFRCKSCGTMTKIPAPQETDDDAVFADLSEEEGSDDEAPDDDLHNEPDSSIFGSSSSNRDAVRRPAGGAGRKSRARPKSGSSNVGKWILIAAGSGAAMLLLCCGGGYFFVSSVMKPPLASPQANEPFPVDTLVAPAFPELGQPQTVEQTGVKLYTLDLATANAANMRPAARMRLNVYLPPGEHPAGSLGCVLVAPAGTNLLTGNSLDDATYHTETLPYAVAGYAVVTYSLDGALPAGSDGSSDDDLARAYLGFSASFAGLANARAALEFVLARLPQVDPRRIFAAGHSSAGTLALLFAEHDTRLKGCVAYAPQTDVEQHLSLMLGLLAMTNKFPGIVDFARRSSPKTHIARIKCPTFLFWAADDSVVAPEGIQQFATNLGSLRQDVTVKTVATGEHYNSMVNPGIGLAIEWLKGLRGEQAAVAVDESPSETP
jgi:dienelactone hydrolase